MLVYMFTSPLVDGRMGAKDEVNDPDLSLLERTSFEPDCQSSLLWKSQIMNSN